MNLYIMPHPPIIISEIGKEQTQKATKTITGMKAIAKEISELKPKVIAIISPHGNVFSDALCINVEPKIEGDFSDFNHSELFYEFTVSKKAIMMCDELNSIGISCVELNKESAKLYNISTTIDHGALVPLHFIMQEYPDFELIHINVGFLSPQELYKAGQIASQILGDDNIFIASGDLSHRLTYEAPAGFNKMGKVYDNLIVNSIKSKNYIDILNIDEGMLSSAGQCAQKPFEMLLGALENHKSETDIYSYEGPFGVGYMTAKIVRKEKNNQSLISEFLTTRQKKLSDIKANEDTYVSLARSTIETYIKQGKIISIPKDLSKELYTDKKGVFVSIKKFGNLRGCIGTIEPSYNNIASEIINNAISASTKDPRFNPIEEFELDDLVISVDVLFPPEYIDSTDALNVKDYGVIVSLGTKRGLLLPNIDGIDTVGEQVSIALQKAGISANKNYKLQRFKVERHI